MMTRMPGGRAAGMVAVARGLAGAARDGSGVEVGAEVGTEGEAAAVAEIAERDADGDRSGIGCSAAVAGASGCCVAGDRAADEGALGGRGSSSGRDDGLAAAAAARGGSVPDDAGVDMTRAVVAAPNVGSGTGIEVAAVAAGAAAFVGPGAHRLVRGPQWGVEHERREVERGKGQASFRPALEYLLALEVSPAWQRSLGPGLLELGQAVEQT